MKIGPLSNNRILGINRDSKREEQTKLSNQENRDDRLDISLDARRKLAELADEVLLRNSKPSHLDAKREAEKSLDKSKLDEIRQKIKSGYYERADIKKEIAKKLFNDLDLDDNLGE